MYLMITNFDHHWDGLGKFNDETWFTLPMLKWNMGNQVPTGRKETIFIKRDKESRKVESCWIGATSNFRKGRSRYGKDCIWFTVQLKEKYKAPKELLEKSEGWYQLNATPAAKAAPEKGNELHPPFFNTLLTTKDWLQFEEYTYLLLRALGIHDAFKYEQGDNRGKADGFFMFGSKLAVLYDATLETNMEKKEQQKTNYINQLSGDTFKFGIKTYTIQNIDKQVWMITQKGTAATVTDDINGIKVKQVPVRCLIDLYDKRLKTPMDRDKFWDTLKDLK